MIRRTPSVSLLVDSSQYQVRLCLFFSRRSLLNLFVVFLLELRCCLYSVRILLNYNNNDCNDLFSMRIDGP